MSLKMAERSEAKSAKRSFASKYFKFSFLTRSFASRFLLRFAQPFLATFKWTINWSLSPQGSTMKHDDLSWRSQLKAWNTGLTPRTVTCFRDVHCVALFAAGLPRVGPLFGRIEHVFCTSWVGMPEKLLVRLLDSIDRYADLIVHLKARRVRYDIRPLERTV